MLAEYQARGKFEGDCDDVSVLNGSVLSAARYPTRFVAIRLLDREEFSHVFTESLIDGEWQVFDPVVPFGTQYPDVTETMLEEVC